VKIGETLMSQPLFQTVIEHIEKLSEEQNLLFELIQKRRIEKRYTEIAKNADETLIALRTGTAKRGTIADLKADLLDEDEE
jgi:hypothetical protein